MPNYRRAFVPGGCWFFTANLLDRRSNLLTDQIEALRDATRRARGERGIWRRRFWEQLIRDEEDYGRHVEYATSIP